MPLLVINSICRGLCSFALIDAAYSTCRITCKPYKGDNCLLRMGMPLLVEAPGAGLSSFFRYLRFEIQKGTPHSELWFYPLLPTSETYSGAIPFIYIFSEHP